MENQKGGVIGTILYRDSHIYNTNFHNLQLGQKVNNKIYTYKDILVPLSIYTDKLSGLEIITKFLRENLFLEFKEIAQLLNRSEKTIWQAYNDSKKKLTDSFLVNSFLINKKNIVKNRYFIPIGIFSNRHLSILEALVKYLKEQHFLTLAEISILLNRDQRTVWTVYHRVKIKEIKDKSMLVENTIEDKIEYRLKNKIKDKMENKITDELLMVD